ncbi:hypothetical protein ACDZ28_04145 [Paenibacillus sp. RS8]|uniref:hypothetical protein n=1 Tax=Paenibacillus sp. RS8 TaxID=3242681 RepID=UPI0035C241DE
MSESGKVSLPMTPEQIEAYKAYSQINRGLPPEMAIELLAALEESQQQNARWKEAVNALMMGDTEIQRELAEAQQTISTLNEELNYIRSIADISLPAVREELEVAQQTIAQQGEIIHGIDRDLTKLRLALIAIAGMDVIGSSAISMKAIAKEALKEGSDKA